MIQENLNLLLKLYYRPLAAMSAIIDEGSLVFSVAAVLFVSVVLNVGIASQIYRTYQDAGPAVVAPQAAAGTAERAAFPGADEDAGAPGRPLPLLGAAPWWLVSFSGTSVLMSVLTLALLYAPATLLLVTLLEPVGSFGVAFRRDFGSLIACTLMAWAAARLPFAVAAAVIPPERVGPLGAVGLWAAGTLYFALLMVLAVRTVFGTPLVTAIGVVSVSWLALALQGYLVFLASPFVLYWAYVFLWGDVGDVTWSFGARQSFKRYLEASTVNPRDAGAQYQLGLVYQRRRQFTEALERFRKAVAIDANEIDAHYQLGRIARLQQRHVDAIRHFEDVVCRDERHSRYEIWREIGATYIEAGCFEHARWALEKYVAQREHDPEGLYLLGDVLRRLGRGETARQYFERCVESVDTTPSYRLYEVRRWRRLAGSALST